MLMAVFIAGICTGTPTTGKFFYMSFGQTGPGNTGFHAISLQTSNGAFKDISAYVSAQQSQMGIYGAGCDTCTTNDITRYTQLLGGSGQAQGLTWEQDNWGVGRHGTDVLWFEYSG